MHKWMLAVLCLTAFAGCMEEDAPDEPTVTDPVVPVYDLSPEDLEAVGLKVDGVSLVASVKAFGEGFPQRKGNHADHVASRDFLADEFAAMGYEVWRQEFTNGIDQENICGLHWGIDPTRWVVVGGHYDMTTTGSSHDGFSQGMYDDASGTMMTVEMARAWADVPSDVTIAFCAFDGEERGLQGSGAIADALSEGSVEINGQTHNVTIAGMLDLDMFGLNWPGVEAPIFFDDNSPELQAFVDGYADALGLPEDMLEFRGISLGRSDYAHFFGLGVPTGFYISDFEEWQLPADVPATLPPVDGLPAGGAYPFWHVVDTWDTMVLMAGSQEDVESGFQMAVDLAMGTLAFLADGDIEKTAVVR